MIVPCVICEKPVQRPPAQVGALFTACCRSHQAEAMWLMRWQGRIRPKARYPQRITVTLSNLELAVASELGKGNCSRGIRLALKHVYQQYRKDRGNNESLPLDKQSHGNQSKEGPPPQGDRCQA